MKKNFYTYLFCRTFLLQALWNFERLQNVGFLYVIYPFLKKMYPDEQKRKEVLFRHIGFFNTNPYMANIIIAMVLNCENSISQNKETNVNKPNMIKNIMAGPVAAIGDRFFWGTWRPFVSFVAIFLFILCLALFNISYLWIIPIAFITLYNIVHLVFRYWILFISFRLDEKMIYLISKLEISFLGDILKIISFFIVLATMSFYCKLYAFGPNEVVSICGNNIYEIFIFAILFIISFLLAKIKPVIVFYIAILLSFILAYVEIL